MWNGFLTLFLEEELKEFNHAYMPGVGTTTAIRDFVLKVRNAKYIYEFDIKGFFNNVSIFRVIQMLRDRGMTESSISILYKLLKSAPVNIDWSNMNPLTTGYDADLANRKAYVLGTGPVNKFHNHLFHNHNTMVNQAMKGLPQGAAPSTILSILALSD